MPIAFRAASGNSAASGVSLVVTKPAGTASGDLLISIFNNAQSGAIITGPSGWTSLGEISSGCKIGVWYKVAGGSEPADYTFTSHLDGRMAGAIAAFSGVDGTTPINNNNSRSHAAEGAAVPFTSLTPSADNCMVVFLASIDVSAAQTYTPPTGATEAIDTNSVQATAIAYLLQTSAAATGALSTAYTGTATTGAGFVVALNVAGGGGGGARQQTMMTLGMGA